MDKKIIVTAASSLVAKSLLVGTLLAASSMAIAGSMDEGQGYPPDRAGRYSIGHATIVLTDASRNVDGSTPAPVETRGVPSVIAAHMPGSNIHSGSTVTTPASISTWMTRPPARCSL